MARFHFAKVFTHTPNQRQLPADLALSLSKSILDDSCHFTSVETIKSLVHCSAENTLRVSTESDILTKVHALTGDKNLTARKKEYPELMAAALTQTPTPDYQTLKILIALGANPSQPVPGHSKSSTFVDLAAQKNDVFALKILTHTAAQARKANPDHRLGYRDAIEGLLTLNQTDSAQAFFQDIPNQFRFFAREACDRTLTKLCTDGQFSRALSIAIFAQTHLEHPLALDHLLELQLSDQNLDLALQTLNHTLTPAHHDSLLADIMGNAAQHNQDLGAPIESLYYAMQTLVGRAAAVRHAPSASARADITDELKRTPASEERNQALTQLCASYLLQGQAEEACRLIKLASSPKQNQDLIAMIAEDWFIKEGADKALALAEQHLPKASSFILRFTAEKLVSD